MIENKVKKKKNGHIYISLRADDNLTLISTVCEAAQRSLFWTPNGLNELPEVRFEFPFNLIGDHDKQSWHVLKSGYTAGSPEQGFRCCFADGVNQSLILSARRLIYIRKDILFLYRPVPMLMIISNVL